MGLRKVSCGADSTGSAFANLPDFPNKARTMRKQGARTRPKYVRANRREVKAQGLPPKVLQVPASVWQSALELTYLKKRI
jgi:hypothetical protein